MDNRDILPQLGNFLLYTSLQVLIIRSFALFDVAFCFIYISVILYFPIEVNRILALVLAFLLGFTVDIFYDTMGIHIAACVFTAFVRGLVLDYVRPSGGYELGMKPAIKYMGFNWFNTYAIVLITVHHASLLLIEASSIMLIYQTFIRVIASIIFTYLTVIVFQYLVFGTYSRTR